jgi:hypothetical protein
MRIAEKVRIMIHEQIHGNGFEDHEQTPMRSRGRGWWRWSATCVFGPDRDKAPP